MAARLNTQLRRLHKRVVQSGVWKKRKIGRGPCSEVALRALAERVEALRAVAAEGAADRAEAMERDADGLSLRGPGMGSAGPDRYRGERGDAAAAAAFEAGGEAGPFHLTAKSCPFHSPPSLPPIPHRVKHAYLRYVYPPVEPLCIPAEDTSE